MSSKDTQFNAALLHPRHWPIWLLFGLWRAITVLPYPLLLALGKGLGLVIHRFASRRKAIAKRNIELCFPDQSLAQNAAMLRANFISTGIATMEIGIAWWWPKKRFAKLLQFEGLENFNAVKDRGIMLLGIHFTTLEVGAAAMSSVAFKMDGMYRAHGNPVYNFLQSRGRISKGIGDPKLFERRDVRGTMKALKKGRVLWYGPDQDYGRKHSVFAPFFGVPAATVTATARITKITTAEVVVFSHFRDEQSGRYLIKLSKLPESYPTDNEVANCTIVNRAIEEAIIKDPAQYWWVHRRFKTRPPGVDRPY